jgi:aldose 1-epimerase
MWEAKDWGGGAFLYTAVRDDICVSVTNYGGAVVELQTRDNAGKLDHVCLGFDSLEDYRSARNRYFGCITGRYCNRIANGQFTLNGVSHQLPVNNGSNCLHGGIEGFDKKMWTSDALGEVLTMRYTSRSGEEGFPGTLFVTVRYSLERGKAGLRIDYEAVCEEQDTVLNITNHSYFNLDGCAGSVVSRVDDHLLQLFSSRYGAVGPSGTPLPGLAEIVPGSAFDFKSAPRRVGAYIDEHGNEQLALQRGYDHSFLIEGGGEKELKLAAQLRSVKTGRQLDCLTTEPFVHLYTGNYLNPACVGRNGGVYDFRTALCLETQHLADSPNRDDSTTLRVGQTYTSTTIFRFSVVKE